jgi:phosphoribosyl-ATP pyrophosphohydrolase/phosphoribosyl-AMP cyclohydrolase
MLGYMNADALDETMRTGRVTFFSRSRKRLWTKGETSGNTLELRGAELDCDNDAILIKARPAGPTCHTGKVSCFDGGKETPGFGFVGELESVIDQRRADGPANSYTCRLMSEGVHRIAQKVGEEAVELALAASREERDDIVNEGADLVYHLLVLLRQQGLSFEDIAQELASRGRTTISN